MGFTISRPTVTAGAYGALPGSSRLLTPETLHFAPGLETVGVLAGVTPYAQTLLKLSDLHLC